MPARIFGPYPHGKGWRCYLKASSGARTWAGVGRTPEEATEIARAFRDGFDAATDLTIGDLIERFGAHQRINDRSPATVIAARDKLLLLLRPHLSERPAAITAKRARAIYQEVAQSGVAVASHRNALARARELWRWAIEEELVKDNPWAAVRPVGRPRRGKQQLTLDEAKRLVAHCVGRLLFDDGAVGVLLALLMGLRTSEIRRRLVRDVDAGGTILRITESKTRAGIRAPRIPGVLREAIEQRTRGRAPDAPLLCGRVPGRAPGVQWMKWVVERLCRDAGVTVVVPHALRGQTATLLYEADTLPELVSALLGQTSSAVTEAHYATPDAVEAAKQRRRLESLGLKN